MSAQKNTRKLESLCGRPATEVVEDLANGIANLIHSSYQVALKTRSTKTVSSDHTHYNPRSVSKKRCAFSKKLGLIKFIQSHLKSPLINSTDNTHTILERNKENQVFCKAISELNTLKPDLPLQEQLQELYLSTKQTINYMDKTRNIERSNLARKKQQKLINANPKQAHKEIFKDKNAQPRAGLQALRDPETNAIETEPTKQAQIIEKYYTDSLKAVNIKHGKYLPEEAPRQYPWEQKDAPAPIPDPFTLQSHITKNELEGRGQRSWLHSKILDKSTFNEYIV